MTYITKLGLRNSNQSGFTLVELMIALVVLAVTLTIVAPAFREIIESNRLRTEIGKTTTALNLARSEAVKRNTTVAICAPDDPNSPSDCTGNMEDGFLIVADTDRDGALEPDDPNSIIRFFDPVPTGYTISLPDGTKAIPPISYSPDGACASAQSLVICPPDKDADASVRVVVDIVGSPRIKYGKQDSADTCP